MTQTIASIAAGVHLVLALALVFLAAKAAHRTRSRRMAWLALAFLLLLTQGVVASMSLLAGRPVGDAAAAWGLTIGSVAMLAFYVGVLRP